MATSELEAERNRLLEIMDSCRVDWADVQEHLEGALEDALTRFCQSTELAQQERADRLQAELDALLLISGAPIELPGFISRVTDGKGLSARTYSLLPYRQLEAVITLWRRFIYIPDVVDTWLDFCAFLKYGSGDCEDFAIAGYRVLQSLGWKDLWIVKVNNPTAPDLRDRNHAVLAVLYEGEIVYLDSSSMTISPAAISNYQPISAVNENGEVVFLPDTADNRATLED